MDTCTRVDTTAHGARYYSTTIPVLLGRQAQNSLNWLRTAAAAPFALRPVYLLEAAWAAHETDDDRRALDLALSANQLSSRPLHGPYLVSLFAYRAGEPALGLRWFLRWVDRWVDREPITELFRRRFMSDSDCWSEILASNPDMGRALNGLPQPLRSALRTGGTEK